MPVYESALCNLAYRESTGIWRVLEEESERKRKGRKKESSIRVYKRRWREKRQRHVHGAGIRYGSAEREQNAQEMRAAQRREALRAARKPRDKVLEQNARYACFAQPRGGG